MILFVCTGNTCRSPMAEYFYNDMKGKGAESAGIYANSGDRVSENTARALKEYGIEIKGHRARRLDEDKIIKADSVICMTEEQRIMLLDLYPKFTYKITTLSAAAGKTGDIPDPYGGGFYVYRECAGKIRELINEYIKIRKD